MKKFEYFPKRPAFRGFVRAFQYHSKHTVLAAHTGQDPDDEFLCLVFIPLAYWLQIHASESRVGSKDGNMWILLEATLLQLPPPRSEECVFLVVLVPHLLFRL